MRRFALHFGSGLLLMSIWLGGAGARAQVAVGDKQAAPDDKKEKRLAFEMREQPWANVLDWLVEVTGLPLVSATQPPAGSFTFISPKSKLYTMPEVFDIVNEGLAPHKMKVVRREKSLALVALDTAAAPGKGVSDKGEAQKKPEPAGAGSPIRIIAAGNKLLIDSDDPKVTEMIRAYVKMLAQSTEPELVVLQLKNASAVEAARMLDELFNGPRPDSGAMPRTGFPFGVPGVPAESAGARPAAGPARQDRIRVVGDPATNSLLVRATPIDLLTIRHILAKELDAHPPAAAPLIRTWPPLRLKHAQAVDIYFVLRDVFRESMNNTRRFDNSVAFYGPLGSFARQPGQNVDAYGNPRGVTLSLAVDDRTNSLIVSSPKNMYEEIKDLAEKLDEAAKEYTQEVVEVVTIQGVDPQVVQRAVEAIQGRRGFRRFSPGRGSFNSQLGNFGVNSFNGFGNPYGGFGGFASPYGGFGGYGGNQFGSPFSLTPNFGGGLPFRSNGAGRYIGPR